MSSIGRKKILAVGKGRDTLDFITALQSMGADVEKIEGFTKALAMLKEAKPDALLIVLPVSWDKAASFVRDVRADKNLVKLPIIYLSSILEGIDQFELKKYNVHTFSLGPVPFPEMARYILKQILY